LDCKVYVMGSETGHVAASVCKQPCCQGHGKPGRDSEYHYWQESVYDRLPRNIRCPKDTHTCPNSLNANPTRLLPGDHNLPSSCVGCCRRYHCFLGHRKTRKEKNSRSRTPVTVIVKDRLRTPAKTLLRLQRLLLTVWERMRDDRGS